MNDTLLIVEIRYEHDVVLARQRARHITQLLGFEGQDQVRIATAVSELARNAFQYAVGGKVEFSVHRDDIQKLVIRVSDRGRGINGLKDIMEGRYISPTGMGVGIIGARKLMDDFSIESDPDSGTVIELAKYLPKKAPVVTSAVIQTITQALFKQEPKSPFEEIQKQNQELLAALDEVQRGQLLLNQLNQELEETNRGVMALSGELEQRADYQRRTSELKTEFLSSITHELRTPLNSIISISGMLLDRIDGELSSEQEKQVGFIHSSARSLSELVNDVLDLAKVEAGKITLHPRSFDMEEVFRILRGMLKPLVQPGSSVTLLFEDTSGLPPLFTDEGKVSQILRNFISNSLKYTQEGQVIVSAQKQDENTIIIQVKDTGIGIAESNHALIFEEFSQVEGEHQRKVKGTGLGLPLTKKLARLLGGEVRVESELGKGSIFSLILPVQFSGPHEAQYSQPFAKSSPDQWERILIIDDNPTDRYILKKLLEAHTGHVIEAASAGEGLAMALSDAPSLIFLDLSMPDMTGGELLEKFRQLPQTSFIPVVIHTSQMLSDVEKQGLLRHAAAILSKSSSQKSRLKELAAILKTLILQDNIQVAHA